PVALRWAYLFPHHDPEIDVLLTSAAEFQCAAPTALISCRIFFASAAGFAASVIGRPTTMCVAPAAIASAGVTTRLWSPRSAPVGLMPGFMIANLWRRRLRTRAVSRAEVTMPWQPLRL